MTSLPVHGRSFDLVVFYSVFTHTYPEETALLLAEARRLLRPGGLAFADLFTSPQARRQSGNRGAVVVSPDLVARLSERAGLRAELAFAMPWGEGRREFYCFRAGAG
jgi:SAM-dependent methyltransferase